MELQHFVAKIHVAGELGIAPEKCVDVFHRWVAQQSMPELLVDVADLLHVPAGPGVVAVGHEADYALDHTDSRWGLLYRRKAVLDGSNADRMAQALQSAAHACRLLEAEFPGELEFSRTEFELIVNDRLLAPNTTETYQEVEPEVTAFLEELLGHEAFSLARHDREPRARFGLTVKLDRPFDLVAMSDASNALTQRSGEAAARNP